MNSCSVMRSFGVLLHEVVTGEMPNQRKMLRPVRSPPMNFLWPDVIIHVCVSVISMCTGVMADYYGVFVGSRIEACNQGGSVDVENFRFYSLCVSSPVSTGNEIAS